MGWVELSSCSHVRDAAHGSLSRDSTLDSGRGSESGQPLTDGVPDKPIMETGELVGHSPGSSPWSPHGAAVGRLRHHASDDTRGIKRGVPFCPITLAVAASGIGYWLTHGFLCDILMLKISTACYFAR